MDSFEDLGLQPQLIEVLASEGIERPTALQEQAIPVLRRGSSAVLQGAPGAGLLVAYGAPLLHRIAPEGDQPVAIILTPERVQARVLALSLAGLALGTGHRVGALGVAWSRPERASILFSTLDDLHEAIRAGELKIDGVMSLVLDGAAALLAAGKDREERLGIVLQAISAEDLQIAVVSDPITPVVRRWVEEHLRRGVFLPPEAAGEGRPAAPVQRGTIRVRTVEDDLEHALPMIVSELLERESTHVVVFARSEDRAADLGDLLALHGFEVGRPGELEAAVWLGVDPLEARSGLSGPTAPAVAVVSVDVPSGPDELDRRHGGPFGGGVVLAHPHELPHLRRAAREAGYALDQVVTSPLAIGDDTAVFIAQLEAAMEAEDLVPYLALLEPVIRRRGASEVAAALAALLRRRSRAQGQTTSGGSPSAGGGDASPGRRPPAWARLFLSVGQRDGVSAGDLLGAIAGETGIDGSQVGRIEVKESFSRVEVYDSLAQRVIRALNGTSIRGRSIRVDYDRGETRAQRRPTSRKREVRRRGAEDK